MRAFFIIALLFICIDSFGQLIQLPQISIKDLFKDHYELDTTAAAIVLEELGSTQIQSSTADRSLMVFHDKAVRIKILSKEGFDQANFSIPLYTFGSTSEYTVNIKATTHNLTEQGAIISTSIKNKDIITEKLSEHAQLTKFTLPDIQVGSVIDITYTIVSPDIYKFRGWQFQSDIPKLKSQYRALIPGMFKYNVTLRGPLKLKDTKSALKRECLIFNGAKMDCSDITYSMENIPAFIEEEHMLAAKNYISAVNFELEEAFYPNGSSKKYTQKWSDVDRELMTDKSLGGQLKSAEQLKSSIPSEILEIKDATTQAEAIYTWIQKKIKWNRYYGKYSHNGVKRSLETGSGNVADINLSLASALLSVGIEAYPILVSTRENGIPNSLHPVISDFNYLICGIKINDNIILADASVQLLPFGELPLHVVNDRGRIIFSKKSSEWIPLVNPIKSETNYSFFGDFLPSGQLNGTLSIVYKGDDAYRKRKEISDYNSIEEYSEKMDEIMTNISIKNLKVENLEKLNAPLIETIETEVSVSNPVTNSECSLNPIFISRTTTNPFNLNERTYPVDMGAKRSETHSIRINFPLGTKITSAPKNVSLVIPDQGAKYTYRSSLEENTLQVEQSLSLNKAIYYTEEYFYLKELFSRAIQQLKIDYFFSFQNQ